MRLCAFVPLVAIAVSGFQSPQPIVVVEPTKQRPDARAERLAGLDSSDDLLRRAASYVAQFEQTFVAVLWREDYQQESRVLRRFNASGARFYGAIQRRRLDSELLFVWLPADATWIAVRDTIAVDGKPRPAAERRLPALLSSSAVSVGQLRQLARENGRFNIGRIVRTFNEPTLALLFLGDHYRRRFGFSTGREESVNGRLAAVYDFVERASPTVIQNKDRDIFAQGTVWIDTETGRVLRTALNVAHPADQVRGRITVDYRHDPKFNVLVPSEMREIYTSSSDDEVTTVATYSDFRRFETAGRIILPQ